MNWKKRVRKIAETNPNALHPNFKQDSIAKPAWYRAEWNNDLSEQIRASRLILSVLHWLLKKQLLTKEGLGIIRQPEITNKLPLNLNHSYVKKEARVFFDLYFDKWLDKEGFNLIISDKFEESKLVRLEQFWTEWNSKENQ